MLFLLTIINVALAGIACPGTGAWLGHAGMRVTVTVPDSCTNIFQEMDARVKGSTAGSWHDPHNGGTYSTRTDGGHATKQFKRVTGNKKYTDYINFNCDDQGDGTAILYGCSESQSDSYYDFSTNYCNLRMLYCGSANNCITLVHDWKNETENSKEGIGGGGSDKGQCIVNKQASILKRLTERI